MSVCLALRSSWMLGSVVFLFFFFSAINYLFRFFFCAIISSFWDSRYTCFKTVWCRPIASRCLIYFILFLCVSVWATFTDLSLSSLFSLIYS